MKRKHLYNIGTIMIILALGVVGWLLLGSPRDMDPVVIYKSVTPHPRTAEETQAAEGRSTTVPRLGTEDKADSSQGEYAQAIEKIVNTPAYLEYKKKQAENFPGFNLTLWWDLLESQDIKHSGREVQEAFFREHFPTGEYEDYEPMMRKRLAELFFQANLPQEPSAISAVRLDTIAVLSQFRDENPANNIWMRGYFNGYDGDIAWANDIRNNAVDIIAESIAADNQTVPASTDPAAMSSTIDVTAEPVDSLSSRDEGPLLFEDLEQGIQTVETLEKQLTEQLPSAGSDLPTEADFQKVLRDRFSPQRFNSAMSILTQYGPEEGFRRLKQSDPEVAAQVEPFFQPQKENK